ncbi:rhodanese-like domain-containing protein [Methylonatrum kenyense]|uniref:rhodanese-like domain-containing protein n=1 Tax=Methylonatrum kenyense TaxID=455253 RepID=UPI0020BF94F0|nr:rhodanese-like domain-containing protein [Methylonatrum kenyense]MCK8516676.1 rhodanese-like domain-containing protein [Methylonatrum kenyense]
MVTETQPNDLADRLAAGEPLTLLDVREHWEVEHAAIDGILHIPMGEVVARREEIPDDRPLVCVCHHGMRSAQVAAYLEQQGWTGVENLSGGIDAWSQTVDPGIPRY